MLLRAMMAGSGPHAVASRVDPAGREMHLKTLGAGEHNICDWKVDFHDEFIGEFRGWSEIVQDAVLVSLGKLRTFGPSLGRPSVDTLKGSKFPNMKELRVDVR
jgi:hypothetical protein